MNEQKLREHYSDQIKRGIMSAADANVQLVRDLRYKVIVGKVPADVRRALFAGVKEGKIAHAKKTSETPEAFYHPDFFFMLKEEFNRLRLKKMNALKGVLTRVGE